MKLIKELGLLGLGHGNYLFKRGQDLKNAIIKDWEFDSDFLDNITIIYAYYSTEGYEGNAHIIYLENGRLYEVNDFHCSCNGLENWNPEETTALAILIRYPEIKENPYKYDNSHTIKERNEMRNHLIGLQNEGIIP